MAKIEYFKAFDRHPVNAKEILKSAEDNFNAHQTKASPELLRLVPEDLARNGMTQLGLLVALEAHKNRFRKGRR